MSKYYGSGLIGLDVKTPHRGKFRRNSFKRAVNRQWAIPVVLMVGIGMIIIAVMR